MTPLAPIHGYVVAPAVADEVVAPPYDALTPEERNRHVETHPRSFLSVLPEAEYTTGPTLDAARARLHELITEGVFEPHPEPFVAIYRLIEGSHAQTGLVAAVPAEWGLAGRIRAHEATRPDRVEQLVMFLERVGVASSPVSLAFRDHTDLVDAIAVATRGEPDVSVDDGDVAQHVWIVEEPGPLLAAGSEVERLYITDGHHRTAAALAHTSEPGGIEAPLLSVLFPAEELRLVDYHRVLEEPDVGLEELVATLRAADWEVEPLDGIRAPRERRELVAVDREGAWVARIPERDVGDDPVGHLDVARFHDEILGAVLGVDDVRSHPGLRFIAGDKGIGALAEAVTGNEAIGFALHPPAMDELMDVADAGAVMPPKSTYFTPKVRSGLFLRFLG